MASAEDALRRIDRLTAAWSGSEDDALAVALVAAGVLADGAPAWVVESDHWHPDGGSLAIVAVADPRRTRMIPRDASVRAAGLGAAGSHAETRPHRLAAAACAILDVPAGGLALPMRDLASPSHGRPPALWGWLVLPAAGDPGDPIHAIAQRIIEQAITGALLRELHATVLDRAPYPINYHVGGERRRSNPAQRAFIGYSDEELAADPGIWGRLSHPDDQATQAAEVGRLWSGANPEGRFELDKRYLLPGGRMVWSRNSYVLARDRFGRPRCQISYLFELTRIKEAERTAAAALAEAQQALSVRSRFLANASHEMRTPLHGIIGALDLLDGCPADDPGRGQLIDTVRLSADLLLRLVNDLLDLARIESDGFRLDEQPCDLRELLDRLLAMVRPLVDPRRIALSVACAADMPGLLLLDRDRISQVLANLVGNAAKFTAAGSIAIVAQVLARAPGCIRLGLAVRDTGTGIPPEQVDGLFAPFAATAAPVAGGQQRGSGLGLAIVRSLVERMGGTIRVDSAPGAGTAIAIEIDVRLADAAAG